jgi:hypothetical protein
MNKFQFMDKITNVTVGAGKDVQHYFVDLNNIERLLKSFAIKRIRHIDDCYFDGKKQNFKHHFIEQYEYK